VSRQLVAHKKPGFDPISKINKEAGPKYTAPWSQYSQYHLARFKALAELDYKVLGRDLTRAPDHPSNLEQELEVVYPRKVFYQPRWFPRIMAIEWRDFQVWTWLTAAKAIGSPISKDAHNYLNLEQTRLEAVEILGKFKLENQKNNLPPDVEYTT
jgi:hypothetical protein